MLVLVAAVSLSAWAAVGDVFTSGSFRFKVIAEGDVNEVEFTTPASGAYSVSGSITTTSVTYNGVTYAVVGIGEEAFKNAQFPTATSNNNLPGTIRYVSANAFTCAKSGSSSTRASVRLNASALQYVSSTAFADNRIQGGLPLLNGNERFSQVTCVAANASGLTANMILLTDGGYKLIAFPYAFPIFNSSSSGYANKVTLANAITHIGPYAMLNNTYYKTIVMPNVQVIDTAAFKGSKITSLTLPASVNKIAADAFEGVTTITSMTINCDLTDDMAGVVFDDAVYERLKEKVTFGANVDVSKYKANANWKRFFDAPPMDVFILGEVNGNAWAPNVGVPMVSGDNINYTATVTTAGENAGYSYFGFTTALAENNDQGGWDYIAPYRFGASGQGDYEVTADKLDTPLPLTYEGYQAFKIGSGTWKLTLNTTDMTLTIEKVMPDVYVMGDVNGNSWAANVGDKMTYDKASDTYTLKVKVTGENGYFGFTTALAEGADDWDAIAANRFGAVSDGDFEVTRDMVHEAQPLALTAYGTYNAFKIPAGKFTLTINDLDGTRTLTISGAFADEIDTTPFDVGLFSYRRISDSEVEMLGFNAANDDKTLANVNFGTIASITYDDETYDVVAIGEEAFAGRPLAGSFTIAGLSNVREIKKGAFRDLNSTSSLARPIGLPASLRVLGDEVFAGSVLSELTIPAGVTYIGNGIVAGVLRLQTISVASANTAYKAYNGDLYTIDGDTLVAAAPQKATLSVREGCVSIRPEAVMNIPAENTASGAVKMTTIVLPSTLATIGTDAFAGSPTFTSVTCNAVTPPTGGVFDDAVYEACKDQLVVPEGSEAAYRADADWGKFYTVIPVANATLAEALQADEGTEVCLIDELYVAYADEATGLTYLTDNQGNWIAAQVGENIGAVAQMNSIKAETLTGVVTGLDQNPVITVTTVPEAGEDDTAAQLMTLDLETEITAPANSVVRTSGYYFNDFEYEGEPVGDIFAASSHPDLVMQWVGFDAAGVDITQDALYDVKGIVTLNEPWEADASSQGAPRRIGMNDANYFTNYKLTAIEAVKSPATSCADLRGEQTVVSVKYSDAMGRTSHRPFCGLNIVTTTYADGKQVTVKVIK